MEMKTIKTHTSAWILSLADAKALGFPQQHIPEDAERAAMPLAGAILFSDARMLVLYGPSGVIQYYDRYTFTEEGAKEELAKFHGARPRVNEKDLLVFMGMMNPDGEIRIIKDDPASQELYSILVDFQLAVMFERMKPKPKVRALLRDLCRSRTPTYEESRIVMDVIRKNPLPDLAFNEAVAAMTEAMNDEAELVIMK